MTPTHPAARAAAGIAALTVALTACTASGDDRGDPAPAESSYAEIADRITDYAATLAETAHVPAVAIGIVTADGLAETRFLGVNHAGDPVTEETVFEIGSATKAFLGVTEALLVERGDLAWDDAVIDHHPDFQMPDREVTERFRIDDLIAQRSGLAEFAAELPHIFGLDWADNVAGLPLLEPETDFRSTFAYQNIPHYVAGQIVADKIGAPSWNVAVDELVFTPLGMTASRTDAAALADSPDTTRGHTARADAATQIPITDFPSAAEGAGSIVSNLSDMARWIGMHLTGGQTADGRLISTEQLDRTYTALVPVLDPVFLESVRMGDGSDSWVGYATGWFVHSLPQGRVIGHGGNTRGYNSSVAFDPDRGVGLVVLTNQGFNGGVATHIGRYGMDLLQGREPIDYHERMLGFLERQAAEEQAELDLLADRAEPIDWYTGMYSHELLGPVELRAAGEAMTAVVGPRDREATVTRRGGHRFALEFDSGDATWDEPLTVEFTGQGPRAERLTIGGFVFERAD